MGLTQEYYHYRLFVSIKRTGPPPMVTLTITTRTPGPTEKN